MVLVCLYAWSVPGPLVAGESGGTPTDELIKVCQGGVPTLAGLKKHYVEWQIQRLTGKLSYPTMDVKDRVSRIQRKYYPRFSDARFNWLKAKLEKELLSKAEQRPAPLKPDELAKLEAWFKVRPAFREKLLLALDPEYDDVPAAVRVALAIREKYPKQSESLENLVIAFAAVWDDPAVVVRSLTYTIPELERDPKVCPFLDSFGWYVQHQKQRCPWFGKTPWRLQIYLTVEGIALTDRDYALATCKYRPDLGTVYDHVEYDYEKLKDRKNGRLAQNPYTLENLRKYGGTCRDQAYYARSVCRAFGMPAYMATGKGNAAVGHCWVGWIVRDARGYRLQSHGRYSGHNYFTAAITDPTTGMRIHDYLLSMEARGVADEKTYDEAELHYRVFSEIEGKLQPSARTRLLIQALKCNQYHREAWLALGEATANGELPRSSADGQWRYLTRSVAEFPDFIFAMANSFSKMHKTAAEKYRFYERTVQLFGRLQRQDLVAKLRLEQAEMCEKEGRKDLAAQVALTGMQSVGSGPHVVELARKAVSLMSEQKKSVVVVQPLKNVLDKTPKEIAGHTNRDWSAIARLLLDVYKETGNSRAATVLENQINEAHARKK
jgi:hypothetical protein